MAELDGQVEHPAPHGFQIDVKGEIPLRRVGNVFIVMPFQRGQIVLAARAHGIAAGQRADEIVRVGEMFALLLKRGGDVVIPHVVGHFVPFPCGAAHYLGIEEPRPARQEKGGRDIEVTEQIEQPPHSRAASEFPLRAPQARLTEEFPEDHRVEVHGEVDEHPDPFGKGEAVDLPDAGRVRVLEHQGFVVHTASRRRAAAAPYSSVIMPPDRLRACPVM